MIRYHPAVPLPQVDIAPRPNPDTMSSLVSPSNPPSARAFTVVDSPLITEDGVRLAARSYRPPLPPRSTAVVLHGFAGSQDDPGVIDQAKHLLELGNAVVTVSLRGHGKSEGLCTLGDAERLDVAAAVEVARSIHPRIVVVGASMGAISALRFAAGNPDIAGVVAVSGPARWKLSPTPRSVLGAVVTRTRVGRYLAGRLAGVRISPEWNSPEEPVELAARMRAPLAIVHGMHDRIVKLGAAHELYHRAPEPRRIDLVERMGHAFEGFGRPVIGSAVEWALNTSG